MCSYAVTPLNSLDFLAGSIMWSTLGNRWVTLVLENADLTYAATTQPIRPTYRPIALAKLDQRTKEARLMRETRAALVAHVGGKPSAVQAAMIERACQLTLRIVAMDRKFAETGAQTDHDSRTYLAWSNSLSGHVFLPCAHALLLDISIIR